MIKKSEVNLLLIVINNNNESIGYWDDDIVILWCILPTCHQISLYSLQLFHLLLLLNPRKGYYYNSTLLPRTLMWISKHFPVASGFSNTFFCPLIQPRTLPRFSVSFSFLSFSQFSITPRSSQLLWSFG